MASQVPGLIGGAMFPASVVIVAVILTAIAMMSNAPGEWARGALTAYVAVAGALIAGISIAAVGGWAMAISMIGVLALIIGGPWGLVIAGIGAAALAIAQYTAGPAPIPAYVAIALCILSIGAALRAILV